MKGYSENESLPHFVLREYDCLSEMEGHDGIIQLLAAYQDPRHLSRSGCQIKFVFPYFPHGDLLEFTKGSQSPYKGSPLPMDLALDFIEQILSALQILH